MVEQYSEESGQRLAAAADSLIEAIRRYVLDARAMRGGTSEVAALFDRNDALANAVAEFSERAFDHTGTLPLPLQQLEENDFEEDGAELDDRPDGGLLSVLSRWNLLVFDEPELLAAGRAAHRRNRPEESEEDAGVAVTDASSALYAVLHEAGEPWIRVPGVRVVNAARVYVAPDEPPAPLPDDPEDFAQAVRLPPGRIIFSEGW